MSKTALETRLDIIDSAIATIEIELAYLKAAVEGIRKKETQENAEVQEEDKD